MALRTDRLRQLREAQHLTKRELARLCDLRELQIHRYESGATDPSTDNLARFAKLFEVSTDYLLGLTDDPHLLVRETALSGDERLVVEIFRRDGWKGIIQLGVGQLSERQAET